MIWASTRENLSSVIANNKGARSADAGTDQTAQPHSLISAFVVRLLKSIILRLDLIQAKFQFSI